MSDNTSSSRVRRFALFPIEDDVSWTYFKRQECALWSANEIDFSKDKEDYESLTPGMKRMVDKILSFFLPGDGMVNKNLAVRFLCECETMEEQMFYAAQIFDEAIHAETYSLAVYTIYNDEKIEQLLLEAENSPYMRAKMDFIEKWTNNNRSKSERFFAFSCVEGVFFSNLFLPIFWFRKVNKLAALIFANKLIGGDEALHRNYGGYQCQKYGGVSREVALEISTDVYNIEKEFVEHELFKTLTDTGEKMEGFELGDAIEFLKVMIDNNLHCNGHNPMFGASNPITWADDLCLLEKENFFEVKGANYTRASLVDAIDWRKRAGRVANTTTTSLNNPQDVDF